MVENKSIAFGYRLHDKRDILAASDRRADLKPHSAEGCVIPRVLSGGFARLELDGHGSCVDLQDGAQSQLGFAFADPALTVMEIGREFFHRLMDVLWMTVRRSRECTDRLIILKLFVSCPPRGVFSILELP